MRKFKYPYVLCTVQPGLVSFSVMMLGFILLALSFVVGVGQVPVEMVTEEKKAIIKEAGYGSAINWSLTLTLVLPAALLYLCKVYQAFPAVLRNLGANRMVVTKDMKPISDGKLRDLWEAELAKYRNWLLVLIFVGLLFCLWEWGRFSAYPLWSNQAAKAPELDWSVGVLFDSLGKSIPAPWYARLANGGLSLLAFLGQAVIVATVLTFVYKALIVGIFFTDISRPEGEYRLVPNPKSRDARLGFELFSELIEGSLICIGLIYGIFYLSRLQNIYLRSGESGMLRFLVDRLLLGIVDQPFDLGAGREVFRTTVTVEKGELDFSSIMVSLGAFAVLMTAAFMIGSTVRDSAIRARSELKNNLQIHPERVRSLFGLSADEVEERLNAMVFWPVRYFRAREFFGLIILGVTCIFFYKMGLVLIGLLMLRVFWDVFTYIVGPLKDKLKPGSA